MTFRRTGRFAVAFAILVLAGCASVMPMDGGAIDDHEATLAKCGVGNYAFRFLREACRPPALPKTQ